MSAESALIAFPINFLLVFLFQNTKPRRSEGALRIVARPDVPADPRSLDAAVLEVGETAASRNGAGNAPGVRGELPKTGVFSF